MKRISIVIPCYNEENNIPIIYNRLNKIIEAYNDKYLWEIIFMDNNSHDSSQIKIKELCCKDKNVKAIFNTRNFGPEANIFNGFIAATGDCVVWICCDMQEPPELIADMIGKWEEGHKLVWGQRKSTEEKGIIKICRSIYYYIIEKFSNVKQYKNVIAWGLYDRSIVDQMKEINYPNPMLRNLVPYLGYEPCLLSYNQKVRLHGKSSYNFFKYFDSALNSIVHTTQIPMKLMIFFGILCSIISFIIGFVYLIVKILNWNSYSLGLAPTLVLLSFIAGVQIFFLGMIGYYINAILESVNFKKHVIEKERINFDNK